MGGWGFLLVRLDVAPHQTLEHRRDSVGVPVLSAMLPGLVLGPDAQHDLQRFPGHFAMLAVLAVHVIQRPVTRDAAGAHAEHEPTLGEVVEIGHPVGQLDRMMVGQQVRTRGELDLLGAQQRLRQQQIGGADRLPRHGEVFADPGLHVAELIGQLDDVQIPPGGVVEGALRWMGRHEEYSDLHRQPFLVVPVGCPARCGGALCVYHSTTKILRCTQVLLCMGICLYRSLSCAYWLWTCWLRDG